MNDETMGELDQVNYEQELRDLVHTPITALAGLCDAEMILNIWSAGVNKGIEIGMKRAAGAENDKLRQINGVMN